MSKIFELNNGTFNVPNNTNETDKKSDDEASTIYRDCIVEKETNNKRYKMNWYTEELANAYEILRYW